MVTLELITYIKEQLLKGKAQEEIKTLLITKGWSEIDLSFAFSQVFNNPTNPTLTPKSETVVVCAQANKSTNIFDFKKLIFIFLILAIVIIISIIIYTLISKTTITRNQVNNKINDLVKVKYLPTYFPVGFIQTGIKMETNKGDVSYIISYNDKSGKSFFLSETHNSSGYKCVKQPETNTAITDYSNFLPLGSTDGCVHTVNNARYFRWIKDDTKFELISMNFILSDQEAMKVANSLVEPK